MRTPEPSNKKRVISTKASHVVPHRSTDFAQRSLTSEIGRDPVLSAWYGRLRRLVGQLSYINRLVTFELVEKGIFTRRHYFGSSQQVRLTAEEAEAEARSEERRVGKESDSRCRSRG